MALYNQLLLYANLDIIKQTFYWGRGHRIIKIIFFFHSNQCVGGCHASFLKSLVKNWMENNMPHLNYN